MALSQVNTLTMKSPAADTVWSQFFSYQSSRTFFSLTYVLLFKSWFRNYTISHLVAAAVHHRHDQGQGAWAFCWFFFLPDTVFSMIYFSLLCCSWGIILHDLTFSGSWVWRSRWTLLLFGHHVCFCHVHPGGHRNLLGQFTLKYTLPCSIRNVKLFFFVCVWFLFPL